MKPVKNPNKIYKEGKLSRSSRFSTRSGKTNNTVIVIVGCVILSFLLAMLLGNFLGDRAHDSQNSINNSGSPSSLGVPSVDKTSPKVKCHAYYADLTGADPNVSLSEQTGSARDSGNALFLELNTGEALIYSSSKAEELGYAQRDNLLLSRLGNHFDYYNDHAIGLFRSDFSSKLGAESRMKTQTNEAILLAEAAKIAFDEIIVEFSDEINKDNAIYYHTYLLNLKLACSGTPIGVRVPLSFLTGASNSGVISELFAIADYCVVDLGSRSAEDISASLDPLAYFIERYGAVVMISAVESSTLADRIAALESKGVKSYIVK